MNDRSLIPNQLSVYTRRIQPINLRTSCPLDRIDSSWLPMLVFTALLRGPHEPFRFVQITNVDLER